MGTRLRRMKSDYQLFYVFSGREEPDYVDQLLLSIAEAGLHHQDYLTVI